MSGSRWFLSILAPFLLFVAMSTTSRARQVTITVDTATPDGQANLELGVTETQNRWENGNAIAVNRAKSLLADCTHLRNFHMMGWGQGDPQPAPGDPIDFSKMKARIQKMQNPGDDLMITFCTAPGWMKNGDEWDMESRVTKEHFADFANLCQECARQFPEVKFFQVWNEMKGFWDPTIVNSDNSKGNWNYTDYTEMYNLVYDAVKAVRPDAKVGGYYTHIAGDAFQTLGGSGAHTYTPIGAMDHDSLSYWLKNKHGADYLCIDRGVHDGHDPNVFTEANAMALAWTYKKIEKDIRALTPDLPIIWSEYYGITPASGEQFIAAQCASFYYHMIKGDTSNQRLRALLWSPVGGGNTPHDLITATSNTLGGRSTPHYQVFKWLHDIFPPGTVLYRTTSSDTLVEVLANATYAMVINKYNETVGVTLNGRFYEFAPYEVRLIPVLTSSVGGQWWQLLE